MQKTLDILEKNVQWIVLGLAVLFLLWVAYGYVLTPPATVKIGSQIVTPGDVALVVQNSAQDLEHQIKSDRSVSFPTPDLVSSWRERIAKPYGVELAENWTISQPQTTGFIEEGPQNTGAPQIAALPQPPAPQILPAIVGLSTVTLQAPIIPQNAPNPAPPAPAPAAGAPAAVQSKDTVWITVPAVIPSGPFKQAMLAVFKNPPNPAIGAFFNTTILRVVVEREQATGTSNGTPVWPANDSAAVQIAELAPEKPYMQPLPPDTAPTGAKYQYLDWAQQNQPLLIDPPFYQVTAGDPWTVPQLPAPLPPGQQPPVQGAQPAAPGTNITPAPATGTTPAAAPNSAGMRSPGTASYAPFDPNRPPGMFPQHRNAFGGGPNRGFNPPGGNGNNQGIINPMNLNNDILIWANDETATPGQTYRYRIRYIIKNPVFALANMAPNNLTNQLAIPSAYSAWSDPVKAPPVTKFWVSEAQRDTAKLDVFRYSDGKWTTTNMTAHPGDEVPGTDLTLVDVRAVDPAHAAEKYVLLTSDTGEMIRHDVNTDKSDPDHEQMLNPNPNGPAQRPLPGRPGQRTPFGGPGSLRPAIGHQ